MSNEPNQSLLEAVLNSWDRNNTITLNLLDALPKGGLEAKAMEGSLSVSEMFTHSHHERLVSVAEEAPEFAGNVPEEEWRDEREEERIAQMLNDSAKTDSTRRCEGEGALRSRLGPQLKPPGPGAPALALARGLPSWSDQAGPQGGGASDQQ